LNRVQYQVEALFLEVPVGMKKKLAELFQGGQRTPSLAYLAKLSFMEECRKLGWCGPLRAYVGAYGFSCLGFNRLFNLGVLL
jgi:hypothetical protein